MLCVSDIINVIIYLDKYLNTFDLADFLVNKKINA